MPKRQSTEKPTTPWKRRLLDAYEDGVAPELLVERFGKNFTSLYQTIYRTRAQLKASPSARELA